MSRTQKKRLIIPAFLGDTSTEATALFALMTKFSILFVCFCPMACRASQVKSDSGCGSTIGPILSALSGIRTVDVGSPQLSMHSIREMMGTDDAVQGYNHIKV